MVNLYFPKQFPSPLKSAYFLSTISNLLFFLRIMQSNEQKMKSVDYKANDY